MRFSPIRSAFAANGSLGCTSISRIPSKEDESTHAGFTRTRSSATRVTALFRCRHHRISRPLGYSRAIGVVGCAFAPRRGVSATSLENKYLGMSETPAITVKRAQGDFVYDSRGKQYIDFVMGWCVGNFGWGNPQIVRAVERYDGPDYVYPEYSYAGWGELARLLASIAPGNLTKSFRATGGSEAVELALQAAMLHTRGFSAAH